jgi:hypothetical protein
MAKLARAERALATLHVVLGETSYEYTRDDAIQHFESTAAAVWKAPQAHLRDAEKIEVRHPRRCSQKAFNIGLLDETLYLAPQRSIDNCNLTHFSSHTYVEGQADQICARVPIHDASFARVPALMRGRPPQ